MRQRNFFRCIKVGTGKYHYWVVHRKSGEAFGPLAGHIGNAARACFVTSMGKKHFKEWVAAFAHNRKTTFQALDPLIHFKPQCRPHNIYYNLINCI